MNTPHLYPLLFHPVYQDYLWGGHRIPGTFNRPVNMPRCAESWELSDRPEGMSVVANGPLSGQTFREVLSRYGPAILGSAATSAGFPLLIKLIDANRRLSVQVHPSDATAARFGGEAKTEMWYVLEGAPDARVFAGLTEGTTEASFRDAIANGTVEETLRSIPVKPGDAIYIPGGRVHAIAEGCLLLEVQQNSNTTYRVYDWGRLGADGQPRALHVEEAIQVIDWAGAEANPVPPEPLPDHEGMQRTRILASPYFDIQRWDLGTPCDHDVDPAGFEAIFVREGRVKLAWRSGSLSLTRGTSCLIPADLGHYALIPDCAASILTTRLPRKST